MHNLIHQINAYLSPLNLSIRKNRILVGRILISVAFLSIGFALAPQFQKSLGEWAYNFLLLILIIGPLARVLGIELLGAIRLFRRELGILMGMLALMHYATFLIKNFDYLDVLSKDPPLWLPIGFWAFILTFLLLITSNNWAVKKLGRWWKRIHRLVYVILILVVVHVVLIKAVWVYKWSSFITLLIKTLIPVIILFCVKIADFYKVRLAE